MRPPRRSGSVLVSEYLWGRFMKRLMKSSLAVALALATGQVAALGLGPIQVKSGLNQPLVAEIAVTTDSPAEANDLRVDLASAEDFERVGLNRTRVGIPIDFAVGSNGRGQTVIKLTTKDAVREPFLDFLIEVNWAKGKLLREYTVLLDPPLTAPAVVVTSKPVAAPAPIEARPVVKPKPVEAKPALAPSEPPVAAKPAPAPAPAQASKPAAAPATAAGQYGPVGRGETLSAIARDLDIADGADLNQVMLALLKANPSAFYRSNINALKAGAVLRIPSADEIRSAGSLRDAAATVREQTQSWREASQPALATNAGAPAVTENKAPAKPAAAAGTEHLALVPPQSGKSNESGSDHGGSGKDGADGRAELARTKETLATSQQESTELKSRVKQLEDINDKGQRLLSLKDSEIADLQNKLKALQAAKAPEPAAAASVKPADAAPAVQPAADAAASAAKTEASTTATTTPAAPAATPTETAATPAPLSPAPASTAPATEVAPTTAQTTPLPSPAANAPVPLPPAKPATGFLSDNPYLFYGIGAILLLIGGWAWSRFARKPKPVVRPQYAAASRSLDTVAPADTAQGPSEQMLADRVAEHPEDVPASLDLLRHYYEHSDAPHFEALAESLHSRLGADAPEWAEVLAMGEALSPHHPLFAEPGADAHAAGFDTLPGTATVGRDQFDTQMLDIGDLGDQIEAPAHADAGPQVHMDMGRDEHLIDEPRFDQQVPSAHESAEHEHPGFTYEPAEEIAVTPQHETALSDLTMDEDTIGTRLDLARAYVDMGDPDGARSMLDEVLAEGSEAQREEARKLLAELP